ncbi:RagB/SusD family nutrient uptake outer membrane protein [Pseudopedobacter beijingensis]|uniref:RagB/SusD family nutrient uptake outer membrane protein n=1 Tax=Pseudopedobacter beijingensis TaxID=1207056 RepID=A0ABW4IEA3_9SPHI
MKINIKYLMLCLMFLGISGCKKDPLDKLPDGVLTREQAYKDPALAMGFLAEIYAAIPPYFDGYGFYRMLAVNSDEAADNDLQNDPGWNAGRLSLNYNPIAVQNLRGGASSRLWDIYWNGIRQANIFLENIDFTPVDDLGGSNAITSEQKKMWIAEARLLRAFFHAELIKYYGGVVITEKSFPVSFDFGTLKRNTFEECANWIVKECDDVLPDLPVRRHQSGTATEVGVGRMTKMIALAIKARVLLYNASPLNNPENDINKWRDAAIASKAVIDLAETTGEYKLYYHTDNSPVSNTYELFRQKDNGTSEMAEVIWQHPNPHNSLGHFAYVHGIPSAGNHKAGTNPSQELVDAFETISGEPPVLGYADEDKLIPVLNADAADYNPQNPYANRDPRLTAFVYYNGAYWGKKGANDYYVQIYQNGLDQVSNNRRYTRTGYYIRKFMDPTRGNGTLSAASPSGQAYWPIFRLAEFYLSYAEAENEVNAIPTAEVLSALNKVRARAGMPDIKSKFTGNRELLRERIRNERRVELCFEEHRFFDVRRWNILDKTDKAVTGMLVTKNVDNTFSYSRFVAEKRYAWANKYKILPIPLNEITNMPLHGQNPGW